MRKMASMRTQVSRFLQIAFLLLIIVEGMCTSALGQCAPSNSPSFQVVTNTVNPPINGTCLVNITIVNAVSSQPGGSVFMTILSPGQPTSTPGPLISTTLATISGVWTCLVRELPSNCTTIQTVQVTFSAPPSLTVVPSSTLLCSSQGATIFASGASSYTWHTGDTTSNIILTQYNNISYTVSGAEPGGCTTVKNGSFEVHPAPSLSVSLPSLNVCVNLSLQFSAHGATSYTWNSNFVGSVYTSPTFGILGSVTHTLQLFGKDSLGCAATKNLSYLIQVDPCDVGIQERASSSQSELLIFPNPAKGHIVLKVPNGKGTLQIKISDFQGRVIVAKQDVFEQGVCIIEPSLVSGIYIVDVTTEDGNLHRGKLSVK